MSEARHKHDLKSELERGAAALRTLHLDQVHAQGYAFQVEMAYAMWRSGYHVREVPIVFIDRRVGHSKMSRRIFIEGFTWVLRTRINGSPVMRRNAAALVPPSVMPATDDATREAPTGR